MLKEKSDRNWIVLDQYLHSAMSFLVPFFVAAELGKELFNIVAIQIIFGSFIIGVINSTIVYRMTYLMAKDVSVSLLAIIFSASMLLSALVTLPFSVESLYKDAVDVMLVVAFMVACQSVLDIWRRRAYLSTVKIIRSLFFYRLFGIILGLFIVLMADWRLAIVIIYLSPCFTIIYYNRVLERVYKDKAHNKDYKQLYLFLYSFACSNSILFLYQEFVDSGVLGELRVLQTIMAAGAILLLPMESIIAKSLKLHTRNKYKDVKILNSTVKNNIAFIASVLGFIGYYLASSYIQWMEFSVEVGFVAALYWGISVYLLTGGIRQKTSNAIGRQLIASSYGFVIAILFLYVLINYDLTVDLMYAISLVSSAVISAIIINKPNYTKS